MGGFLHIQNKGLHICSMCTLCEKHEESIQHLFFECSNALHIWSWVRQIFLTSHFSNKGDLSFIKSDGSLLLKLIKLVVITFSDGVAFIPIGFLCNFEVVCESSMEVADKDDSNGATVSLKVHEK